ncbi:hypothetical protein BLA29_007328 [Euroglyphus maynei]|uniref:Uncharacterized protein n=1 Tax=Euroglyphus maynei TaxID=6958 RepID=A0A1Y3BUN6_EURMA|nr:hypothetical protein BLA29_007328 [Euroglyphus maynei]
MRRQMNDRLEFDSNRFVRYALLTLVIFMLICITLAIVFVTISVEIDHHHQQQQYSDGEQAITLILVFIAANYIIGLIGIYRSNRLALILFATINLTLAATCLAMNHHYHGYRQSHNWAAFVAFTLTAILTILFMVQHFRCESIIPYQRYAPCSANIRQRTVEQSNHDPQSHHYHQIDDNNEPGDENLFLKEKNPKSCAIIVDIVEPNDDEKFINSDHNFHMGNFRSILPVTLL